MRDSGLRFDGPATGLAIAVLAVLALLKLQLSLGHILWNPARGAIDLRYYFEWVRDWLGGNDIYVRADRPEYPPASLPLLYLLVGWLEWPQVRILAGAALVAGIVSLAVIAVRESGAKTATQKLLATMLVLSSDGPCAALGNGQLSPLVVPLIVAAILLLHRRPVRWRYDLVAAAMLTGALVKPSLTLPFLWMALIFPATLRWRPILLVGGLYAGLTFFSVYKLGPSLSQNLLSPVLNGMAIAPTAFDPNIHYLLPRLHLGFLLLPATAVAFVGLGIWIYLHRAADLWLLLAVTALVARFWTYHRVYENVLILMPEIALWRIAQERSDGSGHAAAVLLGLNAIAIVAPGSYIDHARWFEVVTFFTQALVWSTTLVFLLLQTSTRRVVAGVVRSRTGWENVDTSGADRRTS